MEQAFPKLEIELDARDLLEDEKKMWRRIGMYITNEPIWNSATIRWTVVLYDGVGNKCELPKDMGKHLRQQILRWWQVERVKPRASEPVDNTGLAELENRSV